MSLCSQPTELLDAIASFIPIPCDLLSLALTSKLLHGIVIPQHLDFRKVCCDARRAALWKALAGYPGSFSQILSLGLLAEPMRHSRGAAQLRIPQFLVDGHADEETCAKWGSDSPRVLAAAISSMTALTRFCCGQTIAGLREYPLDAVFQALDKYCPHLRELEVTFHDGSPSFEIFSAPVSNLTIVGLRILGRQIWELANLTLLSITVNRHAMVRGVPRNFLAKMFEMLTACPRLQDLRLASEMRGPAADVSGLLADKEWPDLRRLVIEGDLTFTDHPAVIEFLTRHPQLETLSLNEQIHLPHMPNLRWLSIPDFVRTIILAHLPQLGHAVIVYWYTPSATEGVVRTLRALPALRGTTIGFKTVSEVQTLARDLPQLERLFLVQTPWNMDRSKRGTEARLPSSECITALTSLVHLTQLETTAMIPSDPDANADAVLDGRLRSLCAAPKLQYVGVDFFLDRQYEYLPVVKWFSLLRDASGGYTGREEVRNLRKIRYHDWEDVFPSVGIEM
ncbi:hypothetical protein C8R47DRAFT_1268141 [Mycena vitilis]|nr:hypothetical protein C8R47DRAFT_1268141 [Mycena vitilis]